MAPLPTVPRPCSAGNLPRQSSAACWWCRASQLVVQARQRHVVALAGQDGLGVHQLLGHDEQRDALDARNQFAVWPWNLASTRCTMFPSAHGRPGEIHILLPLEAVARAQRIASKPSPSGTRAWPHPTSEEPACGSDRHMVPDQRPLPIHWREHLLLQIGAMHHQQVGVAHREQVGRC